MDSFVIDFTAPRRWRWALLATAGLLGFLALVAGLRASAAEAGLGIFRTVCSGSHLAQVDPIVNPGPPGTLSGHMHDFAANTSTASNSTYNSMLASQTSCELSADTAAYWVPALVDRDGEFVPMKRMTAYYTNRPHLPDGRETVPYPPDFRMIAPAEYPHSFWNCTGSGDSSMDVRYETPPDCGTNELRLHVFFPSCWDGVNIDSRDHMSHVAYGYREGTIYGDPGATEDYRIDACPDSHPIKIPQVRYRIIFPVSDGRGYSLSDGTTTAHADFWNTWDQPTLEVLVDQILNAAVDSSNIHDGNINDLVDMGAPPPANSLPMADAGGPYNGVVQQPIRFDGSGSVDPDPDGIIMSYVWDFGDGGTASGKTPKHTYADVGSFDVTLTVTDNTGATHSATTTATVTVGSQAPVADPGGPYAGAVGELIAFDGAASSDPDGEIVSWEWDFGDGVTTSGETATHAYVSAGSYTVTLTVVDNTGAIHGASTTADVAASNSPPVGNDDAYGTPEGVSLEVGAPGVLANDSDGDGDPLTATLASGPSHGAVDLKAGGSFIYTPPPGFRGSDSFDYRVCDDAQMCASATVTIAVAAGNITPIAGDDAYVTAQGTPLAVAAPGVLGNDTDADGDTLTAVLAGPPSNGKVTLNANGSFTYEPVASFAGQDSFTYTAHDGSGGSNAATVTVTVEPDATPDADAPPDPDAPADPAAQIVELRTAIEALRDSGVISALASDRFLRVLDEAHAAVLDGKNARACRKLETFTELVDRKVVRDVLSPEMAQPLLDGAAAAGSELGCG